MLCALRCHATLKLPSSVQAYYEFMPKALYKDER